MLEGLDQIDWESRNASQVPHWIKGLASDDASILRQAYQDLRYNVVYGKHSSESVNMGYGISKILSTDIPYLITPFLIEILTTPEIEYKNGLLSVLRMMASYVSFENEGEIYAQRAQKIHDLIGQYLETYIGFLKHPVPEFRSSAVELLCQYPEHSTRIFPMLIVFLENEKDQELKAGELWYINVKLTNHTAFSTELSSRYIVFLKQLLVSGVNATLSNTAAVCLVDQLQGQAPENAVKEIIKTMTGKANLPFRVVATGLPVQSRILLKLGSERGIPAAIEIINNTDDLHCAFFCCYCRADFSLHS